MNSETRSTLTNTAIEAARLTARKRKFIQLRLSLEHEKGE